MRSTLRFAVTWIVLLVVAWTTSPYASADCYPCGPRGMGPVMQRLIPQEFHGADFRPACRKHDACYRTPGVDKRACDRQYGRDMQAACNCSSRPICCRVVAGLMTTATVVGGKKAFERGQKLAGR